MTRLSVKTLEPGDVAEAAGVLAVTYGEASTRGSASRMHAFPDPWLIARRDGAAAGVVTANVYGPMAYVAMLAVDPVHRRAGVATALMQSLLDRLEARGVETTLLDATEQAETLYRGLGFVEVDRTRVFAREAPALPATGRRGVESATLERALRLDASIYGCDRSAELRRFVEDPYALVAAEADGYLMARGPVLGPFAASHFETAARLLEPALARRPHIERAFLPLANPDAGSLFEAHGFTCARTLAHMARGAPSPVRRERIYSQASLGHG